MVQDQGFKETTIVLASQVQIPVCKHLESSNCPETLYTGVQSLVGIEIPGGLLVLRCLPSTCTRCRSVNHLQKKVCWVPSICLNGKELAS